MTKEELYYKLGHDDYGKDILDGFFSQNICIPKGTNRHPYADVLHEWIESAEMQAQCRELWTTIHSCVDGFKDSSYRIKPSEPTFEWQYIKPTGIELNHYQITMHYTENEVIGYVGWHKIEETKRIRA